jgi:dihydroorotate dehydrogenase electron transfer subunit
MMAAVVRQLRELNPEIRVYVSLENHMPCGTGACFGCVVLPQGDSALPVRACTEGPVFKADALVWDDRGPVNTWEQTECQRACST